MSTPGIVTRANGWLTTRPWRLWRNQVGTIFGRETKKMLTRRWWLYLLAFAPVSIITLHGFDNRGGMGGCGNVEEDIMVLAAIVQFYYLSLIHI